MAALLAVCPLLPKMNLTMRNAFYLLLLLVLLTACAAKPQAPASVATPQLSDSLQQVYNRLFLEGVCQLQSAKYDAAHDLFKEAIHLNPQAPEAYFELGVMLLQNNLTGGEDGLRLLERAVELDPDNEDYLLMLSRAYLGADEMEKMVPLCQRLLAKRYSEPACEMLYYSFTKQEKYEEAIRVIERMEQHEGEATDESVARRFYALSKMADTCKAFQMAEEYYQRDTMSVAALHFYNILAINLQSHLPVVANYLRQAIRRSSNDVELQMALFYNTQCQPNCREESRTLLHHLLCGNDLTARQKMEVAQHSLMPVGNTPADTAYTIRVLEEALQQPQTETTLWEMYNQLLLERGTPVEETGFVYEELLKIEPDNIDARIIYLRILLMKENFERAYGLCEEGLRYHPDQLVFAFYGGLSLVQMKREDEAADLLDNSLRQLTDRGNTAVIADCYQTLGDLRYNQGRKEEAFAAYDSCLVYDAENALCLNNYAYYLSLEKRDLDRAAEMASQAVQLNSSDASCLDTYAWILYLKRQYAQAAIYIQQALDVLNDDNNQFIIYDHAGDIFWRCNRKDEARTYWQKALEQQHDADEERSVQRKLGR